MRLAMLDLHTELHSIESRRSQGEMKQLCAVQHHDPGELERWRGGEEASATPLLVLHWRPVRYQDYL